MTNRSKATTHADDCWSWGPGHYACAVREIERLRDLCDDLYSDLLAAGSLAPRDCGAYALIQETIKLRRDRWARKQAPNAWIKTRREEGSA